MTEERYPRVLICTLSRLNSGDNDGNNLLLRNLFTEWPREQLAQIYSGGGNGDEGFCDRYYHVAAEDRGHGAIFMRLKGNFNSSYNDTAVSTSINNDPLTCKANSSRRLVGRIGHFIMNSGIYELVFPIRPSENLLRWVEDFHPDIIFAQGYSLSFIWLPILLKTHFQKPLAFFTSDDWPSYLYAQKQGTLAVTAPFMHRFVTSLTRRLLRMTDIPFSFNEMMNEEYERRYGKRFTPIMHSEDPARFDAAKEIRLQPSKIFSIVTMGSFNDNRWPLLLDMEKSLRHLNAEGIPAHLTVLSSISQITAEGLTQLGECRYVTVHDDPGHNMLPAYLKGADLLFLPEVFDEVIARGYRFSVSTKAHLFMFSRKPILVYGHSNSGVVTYAKHAGWACVVDTRSVTRLTTALRQVLLNTDLRLTLVKTATNVAHRNHDCKVTRSIFRYKLVGEQSENF